MALTVAALAIATFGLPQVGEAKAVVKGRKPLRVAVLEFANAASDPGLQTLGKGLQSMLTTDLSKVAALSLIERARLHAILAEQKLGRSGRVDKKTAARIGKLLGATHLLAGSYTVHGAKMRLDARLFAVRDGKIALAEQITGERDAFFELEKALVKKLVAALGVKLRPKERAAVARIHTADFTAFQRFSQGVSLFDAKRYKKAMAALRAAMKLDADFKLARVTLDQYEQLVAQIRNKADALALSQRELAQLQADKVAQNDARVAAKLMAIAAAPVPKTARRRGGSAAKAARLRRLAALSFLLGFYNPRGRSHGRISRFQDRLDRLLIRGRAAQLARRYLAEARAIFPAAPLLSTGRHPPDTPELVGRRVAGLAKALGNGLALRPAGRTAALARNLRDVERFADLMRADRRERIALLKLVGHAMETVHADRRDQAELLRTLSRAYLAIGDVAGASGALTRRSALLTNPRALKSLAARLEQLGGVAKLLARTDKPRLMRELIATRRGINQPWARLLVPGPANRPLLDALARARRVERWWAHRDQTWRFGPMRAHLVQGQFLVWTGPRLDGERSPSIRSYRSPRQAQQQDVLIALGDSPRQRVDLTVRLSRTPAPDFWPLQAPRGARSPSDLDLPPSQVALSLVFGLHGVETDSVRDPQTRKHVYLQPTRGFAVRFSPGSAVELVQLGQTPPAERLRQRPHLVMRVLGRKRAALGAGATQVRLQVQGRRVIVTVRGQRLVWQLPKGADARGFLGLHMGGVGYGEVRFVREHR